MESGGGRGWGASVKYFSRPSPLLPNSARRRGERRFTSSLGFSVVRIGIVATRFSHWRDTPDRVRCRSRRHESASHLLRVSALHRAEGKFRPSIPFLARSRPCNELEHAGPSGRIASMPSSHLLHAWLRAALQRGASPRNSQYSTTVQR